jgi:hypothetical protein
MFLRLPADQVYTPYIGHNQEGDKGYTLIHGHPLNGTKFYTWGQSGPGRFMQVRTCLGLTVVLANRVSCDYLPPVVRVGICFALSHSNEFDHCCSTCFVLMLLLCSLCFST